MTARNLISTLRAQGHEIRLEGSKLLFTASRGTPGGAKAAILADLRASRQEVEAYLVAEANPPGDARETTLAACGASYCAGCYEIGHNLHIHPPLARRL